jgi:hypothetical protein
MQLNTVLKGIQGSEQREKSIFGTSDRKRIYFESKMAV